MKSIVKVLLFLFCGLVLAACDDGFVSWSPDGSRLAFIGKDGLHLGNADGLLSAKIGEARQLVWLPDSQRLLVVDTEKIGSWNECKTFLSDKQQSQAMALADHIRKIIGERGLKGLDKDDKLTESPLYISSAALLNLRDGSKKEELRALLGKELFDASPAWTMDVSRLCVRDASKQGEIVRELWHGLIDIVEARVAPDGKHALLVQKKEPESELFDISIISLDAPSQAQKVAVTAAEHPDWSADGRSIVFIKANEAGSKFGALSSLEVLDASGALIKELAQAKEHLSLVLRKSSDIHCLKDGRILFSSALVTLPAGASELPGIDSVFTYKVGDRFARKVLSLVDAADEGRIGELSLNPGETKVILGRKEHLHIVDLASGNLEEVKTTFGLPPAWRTSDEICFAREVEGKKKNGHDQEVFLYTLSTGKERVISEGWPDAAVRDILINKKERK